MLETTNTDRIKSSNHFYCTCPTCGEVNPVCSDFKYGLPGKNTSTHCFVLGHRCRSCLSHPEGMPVTELVMTPEQLVIWNEKANTPPVERWRLPRSKW